MSGHCEWCERQPNFIIGAKRWQLLSCGMHWGMTQRLYRMNTGKKARRVVALFPAPSSPSEDQRKGEP